MKNYISKLIINCIYISILTTLIYFNYKYIKKTNPFKITDIEISGNDFITTLDIENSIDRLIINKNILNVEINRIQEEIIKNNFIYSVKVYTEMPKKLNIEIVEKTPIALINNINNNYFIDNEKNVFGADIQSINHFINTPIITSYRNKKIDLDLCKNIIMSIYNYDSELYNNLNELIYDNKKIRLFFNNQTEVKINQSNYNNELIAFFSFIKQTSTKNNIEMYKYIDLSITGQIIVKEKKI